MCAARAIMALIPSSSIQFDLPPSRSFSPSSFSIFKLEPCVLLCRWAGRAGV